MPACRQMSLTGTPASACLRIETIWVSVKRDFFMEPPGWGKHARKFYLWGVCGSGKLTGQLALRRNVEGPVREYAERMVAAHGRNNEQIQAWSLDTAAPDAQVQAEKGRAELSRLEVLEGAEFARAYVEAMVTGHE